MISPSKESCIVSNFATSDSFKIEINVKYHQIIIFFYVIFIFVEEEG